MLTASSVKKELARRKEKRKKDLVFKIDDFLFPQQLAFVEDKSPNKIAVCSRRSGKTIACAADLINTAVCNSDVVCLYITLSRNNAKKIIWREIKKINRDYELGGQENLSELSVSFPNGSIIYLSGAKDTNEIEKFRGLALKLVYIDEAQSFREYIKELIDDILAPALMDYAGTLVLIGTPGPVGVGYFAECAGAAVNKDKKTQTWVRHGWTFWDNPFILKKSNTTHQAMLDRELKRRGVSVTDPSIQREWFGKWIQDDDSLLLHYISEKNHYDASPILPGQKWDYILGIDLGYNDADALAILAWSDSSPSTYLIEEKLTTKQGITELVGQIEALQKKYDISKMVIDAGGLGKKIAEELRRQKQIPVVDADKRLKMQNVAFLDDALRTGRFKAKSNSRFAEDCFLTEIDREKTTPDRLVVKSSYHSDIIDAVLYAFKESPAFAYQKKIEAPVYGSKEWAEAQSDKMFEAAQEHFGRQADMERKSNGWD